MSLLIVYHFIALLGWKLKQRELSKCSSYTSVFNLHKPVFILINAHIQLVYVIIRCIIHPYIMLNYGMVNVAGGKIYSLKL